MESNRKYIIYLYGIFNLDFYKLRSKHYRNRRDLILSLMIVLILCVNIFKIEYLKTRL